MIILEDKKYPEYTSQTALIKESDEYSYFLTGIKSIIRIFNEEDQKFYITYCYNEHRTAVNDSNDIKELLDKQKENINDCYKRFIKEVELARNLMVVSPVTDYKNKLLFKLDEDQRTEKQRARDEVDSNKLVI